MTDRLTMTIEHARINHKRVLCGPGVPGCGPDREGGPDGKPAAFCPTCGVWPCSTAILLGEVDRLRSDLEAPGSAWAQRAEALAEVDRLTGALKDARDGMASAESGWEDDPHGACYRVRLNVEAALKPGDPIIQKAIARADAARADR